MVSMEKKKTELAKEEIWTSILKETKAYDDIRYRKLCNELLENYEQFLVIEKLRNTNLLKSNLLLESINELDHKELVEKHINKSNRLIEREIDRSADFHLQKYLFGRNLQSLKTNYERKLDKNKDESLAEYDKLAASLDTFYVIERLRHAIELLTWAKLYKTEIEQPELTFTFELIKSKGLGELPAVKIYSLMYDLVIKYDDSEKYFELKDLAQSEINSFPPLEQRGILDVLLSCAIKGGNKGDKESVAEMLSLYEWGIDTEIIFEKGFLSPTTFRNYVVGGLRIGEIEKVEKFISEKAEMIEASRRENAVVFNRARVAFHKKEFEKVIELLSQVNYDEVWYNLNSKVYLLASYFELDEYDALSFQIGSFQKFLRREKSMGEDYRKGFLNFSTYLKRIMNKQIDKKAMAKLRDEISGQKAIYNRRWLLEKVDALL